MKFSRSACLRFAMTAALLLGAVSAQAQFRTSVQGSVTDPTGAVIPGATLTLKDNGTNLTTVQKSDSSGVYNFNALPADHFTLTVTAPGFKTKVLSDLQFIPEQANSVNVQLDLGGSNETVTVDASTTPAVDTETANIGGTISANEIQHTPSFNRDVFTLSQLIPGVISDGSQGSGGGVYNVPGNQGPGGSGNSGQMPTENGPQVQANGGQYGSNSISLDGISTVSAVWGGTTIITPTEESIDNVRIVSNDYDAENGRFSGAQTMVTTKSGTNQLHGSAFLAIHRPGLNAYQRPLRYAAGNIALAPAGSLANTPQRDTQRFNQYGGSLGGPIWKDKIFAFFAYESSPNSSSNQSNGWYETSQFRSAANQAPIAKQYNSFAGAAPIGTLSTSSQTCTSVGLTEGVNCRTIAGQGLDIGSPLTIGAGKQDLSSGGTAANPGVGNGLDGIADVAYYTTTTPFTSYYRQYAGRADWNATSRDRLSYTIYWVPTGSSSYNGGARGYDQFNHTQINEAMSVIWNHTFSPTFLNEARANTAGWRWNEIADNPQEPVGLPADSVTFAPNASLNQFGTNLGSTFNQWTYTYKDIATKIAGRHTIKFGAEATGLHYLNNPTYLAKPNYGFYNIWDFLNDAPYQESGTFNSITGKPGSTRSDEREYLFAGFVQDSFKVKPNLTLTAGIRYSYFGPLYAKQNNLPHVLLGTGSTTYTGLNVVQGGNLWNAQKGNFGPQLGFNWAPQMFQNKLIVRGGFGLSFNQEEIAITGNAGNNPPTANYRSFNFNSPSNPGTNGNAIIYALSSSPTSINGYPANPNTLATYNQANLPTNGNASIVIIGDGHGHLPTSYTEHYSLNTDYEMNREIVLSAGYQGSLGRHLINHETPNAPAIVNGYALNPLVTGGDDWTNEGMSNNNALMLEAKHPMVHHFSADAQFMWAKSMDTDGSGPYYEDPYFPLNAGYSYGRSDYNIGKSFKAFGLWQPVLFHGHNWAEKVAGGWSLSGIFNWHTGFPYSPTYGLQQSLYCSNCGYYNLRPYYNGQGGTDHSNNAFINGTNFNGLQAGQSQPTATVNGSPNTPVAFSNKYFTVPNFQPQIQNTGSGFPNGNVALPGRPVSAATPSPAPTITTSTPRSRRASASPATALQASTPRSRFEPTRSTCSTSST